MAKNPLVSLGIVALVYGSCFVLFSSHGFWIVDNANKYILTRTIIENDYRDLRLQLPGESIDSAGTYNPMPVPFSYQRDGGLYSIFPPFFAMISSFPYRVFGFSGLFMLPLLSGLLAIYFAWKIAQFYVSNRWALHSLVLLIGLGSPVWFYSLVFWENIIAVLMVLVGMYQLIRHEATIPKHRAVIISALWFSLSVYFRHDFFLAGLAWVIAYKIPGPSGTRHRSALWAGSFVLGLVPLALLNQLATGSVLGAHVSSHLQTSASILEHVGDRPQVLFNLLLDSGGSAVAVVIFAVPLTLLLFVRPRSGAVGISAKVMPAVCAVAVTYSLAMIVVLRDSVDLAAWLRASSALFAMTPIIALGTIRYTAPVTMQPKRSRAAMNQPTMDSIQIFIVVYVLLYLLFSPVIGSKGIIWSNRHLLLVFPILSMVAVHNISLAWSSGSLSKFTRSAIAVGVVASIGWQVFSMNTLHSMKEFSVRLNAEVDALEPTIVMTDLFWVPQTLYSHFLETPMFFVRDRNLFQPLVQRVADRGYREAVFITQAAAGPGVAPVAAVSAAGIDYFSVRIYKLTIEIEP